MFAMHPQVHKLAFQQDHVLEHAVVQHVEHVGGAHVVAVGSKRRVEVREGAFVVGEARVAHPQGRVGFGVVRVALQGGLELSQHEVIAVAGLQIARRHEVRQGVVRVDFEAGFQGFLRTSLVVRHSARGVQHSQHVAMPGAALERERQISPGGGQVFINEGDLGAQAQQAWIGGRVLQRRVEPFLGLARRVVTVQVDATHADDRRDVARIDLQGFAKPHVCVAKVELRQKQLRPRDLHELAFVPIRHRFTRVRQHLIGVLEKSVEGQRPRDGDLIGEPGHLARRVEIGERIQQLPGLIALSHRIERRAKSDADLQVLRIPLERRTQNPERCPPIADLQLDLAEGQGAFWLGCAGREGRPRLRDAAQPRQRAAQQGALLRRAFARLQRRV